MRDEDGQRGQAYDVYLRGGLGRARRSPGPVFRRVPTGSSTRPVDGLVGGWLAGRADGESFRAFCDGRPTRSSACCRARAGAQAGERRRPREQHRARWTTSRRESCRSSSRAQEPEDVLEWAHRAVRAGVSLSTAFQDGDVALIDMAYAIDPSVRVFIVDTGRLPQETYRPDRAAARALSRAPARAALAGRRPGAARWSTGTGRTSSTGRSRSGCSAATSARCSR